MISAHSPRSESSSARVVGFRLAILLAIAWLAVSALASPVQADSSPVPIAADGEDEVLTLDEAAALLKIHPEMLSSLAADGTVPGRHLGPYWRFSRSR